jgi:hypothetical protein
MAITLKDFEKYKNDASLYAGLNDANKKKFWDYGTSQGLVPVHLLNESMKAEMSRYTSGKYIPRETTKEQQAIITKEEDRFARDYIPQFTTGTPTQKQIAQAEELGLKEPVGAKIYTSKPSTRQPYTTKTEAEYLKPIYAKQTLKERDLEPVIPVRQPAIAPTIRPVSTRLQDEFGNIPYTAPKSSVEAGLYGVAEGIKGGFGGGLKATRSPEEQRIFEESANFKGLTLPSTGGGLSSRLQEDFGQSEVTAPIEIGARDIGMGVGRFGAEAAKYATLTPILTGTKLGSAIVKGAEKIGLGKFGQAQVIDAFTDMAIQAPTDVFGFIESDATLEEGTKQWLTDRVIDLAMNAAIGGAGEALKKIIGTKQGADALKTAGIEPEAVVKAIDEGDTEQLVIYVNQYGVAGKSIDEVSQPLLSAPKQSKPVIKRPEEFTGEQYLDYSSIQDETERELAQLLGMKPRTKEYDTYLKEKDAYDKWRSQQQKLIDAENKKVFEERGGTYMEEPRQATSAEFRNFKTDTTGMSSYDDYLDPKQLEYKRKNKGENAYISEMTPKEYIERVSKQIFKKPVETQPFAVNKKDVSKYVDDMGKGDKFPMPVLDYRKGMATQEGRHRAFAAEQAGLEKIPVLIVDTLDEPMAKAYAKNKPMPIIKGVKERPFVATKSEMSRVEPTLKTETARMTAEPGLKFTKIKEPVKSDLPKYYHGSSVKFDEFDQSKTGGLISLTEKKGIAEKYASRGGGSRQPIPDSDKYLVSYDGDVYTKEADGLWHYKGYDESGGGINVKVKPTDKKMKPLKDSEVEAEYNEGMMTTVPKNPNVLEVQPRIKKTLDVTGNKNVDVLAKLDDKGDVNARMVIDNAKEGKFDWWTTKYEASNKHWQNVINPQLEKLGYDSIKFSDDQHDTLAVFRTENVNKQKPSIQVKKITPTLKPKVETPKKPPIEDTRSRVMVEPQQKIPSLIKDKSERVYQELISKNVPLEKIGGKANIQGANINRMQGTIEYNIKNSQTAMDGSKLGKSADELFKYIDEAKKTDFYDYVLNKHNIQRYEQGKPVFGEGFDSKYSADAVKAYEAKHPEFKDAQKEVTQYFENLKREWGVKSGLISKETADLLTEMYPNYVPTYRAMDLPKGLEDYAKTVSAFTKKAKGSERFILPIDDQMKMLTARTIRNARKNELMNTLNDMFQADPTSVKRYVKDVKGADAEKVVDILDIGKSLEEPPKISGDDYILNFYKDGKPMQMTVNRTLYKAMESVNSDDMVYRIAQAVRKYATNPMKAAITGYNPVFAASNVMRDIPTALVYSSNPIKMAKNAPEAIEQMLKNGDEWQRFQALGGSKSGIIGSEKNLTSWLKKNNPIAKVGAMNDFTESLPRFSEYLTVLKETGDPALAIYRAAELTTDFSRHGNLTKLVDSVVPYLNPSVQGIDKFFRSIVKDPIKTSAKGAAFIAIPTMILDQVNKDNEAYNELSPRERNLYFQIPIPNSDKFLRVPKSRELGVMFSSIFEWAARASRGEKVTGKEIAETIKENFTPVDITSSAIWTPAQKAFNQIKDPDAYETNYWGSLIVPESQRKYSPGEQYDLNSSGIAKAIGKEFNISPFVVDYLLKSYTGIVGQVVQPIGADKRQSVLAPLTNKFITDPVFKSNSINNFYEELDKAKKKAQDFNKRNNVPSKEITDLEKKANALNKVATELSDIRKKQKALQVSDNKDRDALVRELQKKMNELAKKAVQQ